MGAYILNIGDEVLTGKVINTNASFLATRLQSIGIDVQKIITIGDDQKSIIAEINNFLKSSSNILITTGGLGPSEDDITKVAVSKALGLKMRYNNFAARDMFSYFGEEKKDCNRKQLYFPENAKIIRNKYGSADGAIIFYKNKLIILLVGPPYELKPMFENAIFYLLKFGKRKLIAEKMLFGNSESFFENLLSPLRKSFPNIEFSPYVSYGIIRYFIKAEEEHKEEFNNFLKTFDDYVGNYLYSNNNQKINFVLVDKLKQLKLTVSVAESCTGGLIAKLITDVPGASEVLSQSFVTYSENAKITLLNVNPKVIEKYGVVSTNVTHEMILGLEKLVKADIYASISGYAGPTGDVGKVCYSIKYNDIIINQEKRLRGNREIIRMRAAYEVIYQILLILKRSKNEHWKKDARLCN